MDGNNKSNGMRSKKSAKLALSFIMMLLMIILIAFLAVNFFLNKINRENTADIISAENESFARNSKSGMSPDDIVMGKVTPLNDGELINIMLIGQDSRPGEGRQRSDTMILCSINPNTKEVSLVSFLRDLYVQLPGDYSANRLNTAYMLGGFELLKQTMRINFGITVDGCFGVDFGGFEKAIDIVGGVDVELSGAEAAIVGGGARAGMNHLNGAQALEYARIRKLDSDFGRSERQRNVLSSAFKSLGECSMKQCLHIADELLPCMTTDMSNTEIISLISHCYKLLGNEIETYHIPEEGAYCDETIRGMAVLVPDLPVIRNQLETYLPLS